MGTQAKASSTVIRAWLLLFVAGVGLLVALLWPSLFSQEPLTLRFLYYTNNAVRTRIAMMEISNRTGSPYEWTLHSEAKAVNHVAAVTDLVETNGELRSVSPMTGGNLFGHDALQFGTDEFEPGKRLWVATKCYPNTADELRGEKLSGWLWRNGLHGAAPYVGQGRRINGPVLPQLGAP